MSYTTVEDLTPWPEPGVDPITEGDIIISGTAGTVVPDGIEVTVEVT